jgi:heterodisulfide reductase subunit A
MHKNVKSEFNVNLSERTAIYVPFPQAVPLIPALDRAVCLHFKKGGKCVKCYEACGPKCIDFNLQDEVVEETVGAIVAATGYDLIENSLYGEYGYGKYKDVVSGLQFERLLSASGPTEGLVKRPSDGVTPKTIVFIQCVGSRDPEKGVPYCSKVCCMYTAKHAKLFAHKVHGSQSYVFYIDIRATSKGYEEFVRGTMEQDGAIYLRGRVSRIYEDEGKLIIKGADTLSGNQVEIAADMVVLATGVIPKKGSDKVAQMLGISYDKYGFYTESHPKLRPTESSTAGIFLAGMAQGPRDIPESVVSGSAAASKILGLFSKNEYEVEGTIASVNEATCVACFYCRRVCAYNAISGKDIKDRSGKLIKVVANVNPGLCTGCGACVNACFSKSIDVKGFMDDQIYAEIKSLAI